MGHHDYETHDTYQVLIRDMGWTPGPITRDSTTSLYWIQDLDRMYTTDTGIEVVVCQSTGTTQRTLIRRGSRALCRFQVDDRVTYLKVDPNLVLFDEQYWRVLLSDF